MKYRNLEIILGSFFNFLGAILLTIFFLKVAPDIAFIAPLFFLGYFGKKKYSEFSLRKLKDEINEIKNLKQNSIK